MLTSVLRDSLGGNCMTTMIATLAVDKKNLDVRDDLPKAIFRQDVLLDCQKKERRSKMFI